MGLLTFAVPNYKTVLGTKISFPHCFRKSVMFGLCFLAFTGGGGRGVGWGFKKRQHFIKGDAILRP